MVCLEWPREGQHSGGVGRYAYRLATELVGKLDLSIVTFEGGYSVPGATMHFLPSTRSRFSRFYLAPLRIRKFVRGRDIDVIHAHGDDWALGRRWPVVRSFHGSALSEAQSSRGLRRMNHYLLWALEKVSARRAVISIAVAPETVHEFACEYIVPPITSPQTSLPPDPTETPTFVFIGSFHGRKRGWLAAEAIAEARSLSNKSISLVVVGPSTDAENWPSWVDHRSGLDDREVSDMLRKAWGLLAPSTYEGFGIPTVEALRVPIPVMATQNPGNDYFVSLAFADLPLFVSAGPDDFKKTVHNAIKGTKLTDSEVCSAKSFTDYLLKEASAQRVVELYRLAIERKMR
ncbi:glycosyltransferase family 4 protein [Rhodococcoides fascians]|uniref:glycosyltransferase family 4 protein n=2 Tax=Nocardiaceae TaxID=85025 RepID=UPI001E5C2680|nr:MULTISPECIES: glycosyltransferase family 4 protein [Rhodococcus]